jgi:hypothetical protein
VHRQIFLLEMQGVPDACCNGHTPSKEKAGEVENVESKRIAYMDATSVTGKSHSVI